MNCCEHVSEMAHTVKNTFVKTPTLCLGVFLAAAQSPITFTDLYQLTNQDQPHVLSPSMLAIRFLLIYLFFIDIEIAKCTEDFGTQTLQTHLKDHFELGC